MVNYYNKETAIPLIMDMLTKEGYSLTEDNIKVWSTPTMKMLDVKLGCNYVKSTLNSDLLIYTNKVPNKDYLSHNEKVTILDCEDLQKIALKQHNHHLYDIPHIN